jgi:hypothetical protein
MHWQLGDKVSAASCFCCSVCSSLPANGTTPEIGLCAADLSPLFMLGSPDASQVAERFFRSGQLMNVTVPSNYTPYVEPCTNAVAT